MSAVARLVHAPDSDALGWMRAARDRVERALDLVLPPATVPPCRLHEAMRYATLGGGKRVRAMLVYAAGEWASVRGHEAGADDARLDAAAAAVELIHAYSLVHDDLPCMDDDDLRRGRPTVHVAYDEATALLVGDALQSLAFEVLALSSSSIVSSSTVSSSTAPLLLLAKASGSLGMAGGQAIDLDSVGKPLAWPDLEVMHRAKTGALLRASVLLGATSGATVHGALPAREAEALDRYAGAVGLAFQVVDDILDVETDSATLGKTAGKDAEHDKPTAVTTLGLAGAKALSARLRDEAHQALAELPGDVGRLRDLAAFIIDRSY
jgi:farnesyl diphosphate synthase